MHLVWGLVSPVNQITVMLFAECLCQELKLATYIVAVVIGTHVCSVARLALTIVTSRLEHWEVVDKIVIVKPLM